HHPGEIAMRLEPLDVPGQQQRVRAQEDDLAPGEELADDLVDLRVHERLTTGDRHHRRAALLDRADRLLYRHALLQQRGGLLDLAAAGALQVAGEQRLELDQERELLAALQLLPEQVAAQPNRLTQWHGHVQHTSRGSVTSTSSSTTGSSPVAAAH